MLNIQLGIESGIFVNSQISIEFDIKDRSLPKDIDWKESISKMSTRYTSNS